MIWKAHPTQPRCYKCPDRALLVEQYGTCHNEHCPHGWAEFEKEKAREYERRKKAYAANDVTVSLERKLNKRKNRK